MSSTTRLFRLASQTQRRGMATVRHDLGLYNIPAPPSAVRPRPPPKRPLHDPAKATLEIQNHHAKLRWMMCAGGAGVGALAYLLATGSGQQLKTEAPSSTPEILPGTPIALQPTGEVVDSGTTSVPGFPKKLVIEGEEYALVGLGIRTVSFLSIQVYVVGFYVHADDLAALQKALVQRIEKGASSLTSMEKQELRQRLLDPVEGEKLWEEVLENGRFRSAFRIVPTRNTDFQHLRDGWVRGIQQRSTKQASYEDERFAGALGDFKALFGGAFKKSVPKQKTLLLVRDKEGVFKAYYDPTGRNDGKLGGEGEEQKLQKLGEITEPRIAKALWLCYLAGAKPASEPARKSIVEGVLEMASRPADTLAV